MNVIEFSNEFDILYNNITSNQALPLDEYEKSVLLTDAQDQLVKMSFSNKLNPIREGFDDSERRQMDFSTLVREKELEKSDKSSLNNKSTQFILTDENIMYVLNIDLTVNDGESRIVIPMHYKEYQRLMSRPYKYPLKNLAWAVMGQYNGNHTMDITTNPNDKINTLRARYVRLPNPIVLTDLEDGLSVRGISKKTECELNEITHRDILKQAVLLAKASYLNTGLSPQQSKE